MTITPTNWSAPEDTFSATFYKRYVNQFWLPEEIALSEDVVCWKVKLTEEERQTYILASAGLNLLDTVQGETGMATLHREVEGHIRKATLQFQGAMEDIHAKSYSLMNKTFLTAEEERQSVEWAAQNPLLQLKARLIVSIYESEETTLWQKMAASVLLESALFYSGFFFPLYLAGQGKMTASGEIFSLIIKDEAQHGVYIGLLAQELYAQMSEGERTRHAAWFKDFATALYENELEYSDEIYGGLRMGAGDTVEGESMAEEVKKFVRFNFNVATDNLGLERMFDDEEINPVVAVGLEVERGTHDFFSAKGSSYSKMPVGELDDTLLRGYAEKLGFAAHD